MPFLLVLSFNYTLVSFSPSKNAFINTELVPVLALGIIIMGLASKRAVHITTPFILERAWQGRVLLFSRQVLRISLSMHNSNWIRLSFCSLECFFLKHQTLISTLYGHLQWCGLDYWGIYIIAITNEKLIVNKISQRDEKEKSRKQNCF